MNEPIADARVRVRLQVERLELVVKNVRRGEQRPRRLFIEQPVVADVELGIVLRVFAARRGAIVIRAQVELRKSRLALDVSARANAERIARARRTIEAQLEPRIPRQRIEPIARLIPRRRPPPRAARRASRLPRRRAASADCGAGSTVRRTVEGVVAVTPRLRTAPDSGGGSSVGPCSRLCDGDAALAHRQARRVTRHCRSQSHRRAVSKLLAECRSVKQVAGLLH